MTTTYDLNRNYLLSLQDAQPLLLKAGALKNAIFNSANFSCIATDKDGVIQIFNVGAERMLGYRAADVVDKITPADISDTQEIIARAAALSLELETPIRPGFEALVYKASHGIEDIYELTYIRKDGSLLPATVSVTALRDAQDGVIGYLLIGTDNTARKQVEVDHAMAAITRMLRDGTTSNYRLSSSCETSLLLDNILELESAKAAAEKANLAKSDFLSSMSHELRTPLNAVLGFAQLLQLDTPPPSLAQKQSINQILKAGWHLLGLINDILDLAKIESGKATISHEVMSLTDVLQDCQTMIALQAEKRGIQVTFPRFDHPLYVYADRIRVKQVMINLLSNAIKYNRAGGALIVQCTMSGEKRVSISVKDTGVGLTPEQLAQLFQPFNRLGQEAGEIEGTGIGLVVTKQLVELMGGVIGVESIVGTGSVFWFELPLSSASAPMLASIADAEVERDESDQVVAHTSSPKRTLLYVEDNPANLALVEQVIARRNDLTLLSAIDARMGIQMARVHLPDMILMDINLPGISGYEALDLLRHDRVTAHIPVMALSANAIPRDIEQGLQAGFFRYLTKPIKVKEFMEVLDVALLYATENGLPETAKTENISTNVSVMVSLPLLTSAYGWERRFKPFRVEVERRRTAIL